MALGLKSLVSTPVAVVGGAVGVGIIIYALSTGRAPDAEDARAVVSEVETGAADVAETVAAEQSDGDAGEGAGDASTVASESAQEDTDATVVVEDTGTADAGEGAETPVADADDAGMVSEDATEAESADVGSPEDEAVAVADEPTATEDAATDDSVVADVGDAIADDSDAVDTDVVAVDAEGATVPDADAVTAEDAAAGNTAAENANTVAENADADTATDDVASAPDATVEDAPSEDAVADVAAAPDAAVASPGLAAPNVSDDAAGAEVALLETPKPALAPAVKTEPQSEPDTAETVAAVIPTQPQAVVVAPKVDEGAQGVAPQFDLVRVDKTGATFVAGRAAPNTDVEIIQNGQTVATVTASARGEFVALFDTDVSAQAQSLNLASRSEDGGPQVFSESSVIVLGRDLPEIDADANTLDVALPPAVIQATPEAVTVLQPVTGLADLENVSLDSISYDAQGEVVLAGRGRPGNVARAYVNDAVQAETGISDQGSWRVRMAGLLAGRYVLRIDEVDAAGKVVSRVESPFQRVYPSAENLDALGAQRQVVIQRGDNLWNIARVRYGDGFKFSVIYDANVDQIRDPDLIYPGQIFDVPNSETGVDDQ